jgi:two-component system sensor histidine kinase UhpB
MNMKLVQQFARRAIHAQEQERKRISQEIHDDLGNRMALLALSARQIIKQNRESSHSISSGQKEFFDQISDLSSALRNLSHALHPPLLRYVGIRGALITLREKFQKAHGVRVNLVVPEEVPQLSEELALCIFRVAQECLQNVVKHSQADSVTLALQVSPLFVRLVVSDSGQGFLKSEAMKKSGIGLLGMESRAVSLGGTLTVSSSPGAGTDVQLTIPFRPAVEHVWTTPHKENR